MISLLSYSGQSPADAEFNLLDTARKVDLYGIEMHPAKVGFDLFWVTFKSLWWGASHLQNWLFLVL